MAKEHKFHHSRVEIDTALPPQEVLEYARQTSETVTAARYRGDFPGGVALSIKNLFGFTLIDFSIEATVHGNRTHVISALDDYNTSQTTYMFVPISPKSIEGYSEYKRYLRTFASVIEAADPTAIHTIVERGSEGGIFDPTLQENQREATDHHGAEFTNAHQVAAHAEPAIETPPVPAEAAMSSAPAAPTRWTTEQATALVLAPDTSPEVLRDVVAEHPSLSFFAQRHPSGLAMPPAAPAESDSVPLTSPLGIPAPTAPPLSAPSSGEPVVEASIARLAGSPYAALAGPLIPATPAPPAPSPPTKPAVVAEPAVATEPVHPVSSPLAEVSQPASLERRDDDDVDVTVLVERVRPRTWRLVMDNGTSLPLMGGQVLLGRKPVSTDPHTQAVTIPDPTITLSKVHARLDLVDDVWYITDLNSTNGVIFVLDNGNEQIIAPGNRVPVESTFLLGTLSMSIQQGND